jgi:hypothetical protein
VTDSTATPPPEQGIRVMSQGLSAEEIAAVTAVIEANVEDELAALHDEVTIGPSAWEKTQRPLRSPLHPGVHEWRSFSG